jgi:murein DD-endopeptidase MepM/ murein hydrolase activator NlpD
MPEKNDAISALNAGRVVHTLRIMMSLAKLRFHDVGLIGAGLALAFCLSSCVDRSTPAPVVYRESAPEAPSAPPTPPAPKTDIVNPVPPRVAVETTRLGPPAQTTAVQSTPTISVPPARVAGEAVVAAGDTLYSLSKRYDVALRDMIDANNLKPPYTLAIGQKLVIPGVDTHTVAKGETAYSISRLYDVDLTSLLKTNDIGAPYTLRVGQRLNLPPKVYAAEAMTQPVVYQDPKVKAVIGAPPPRTGKGFAWPVRGQIISRFGAKPDGLHNDGINIKVEKGAPVRAADNGVVVYAGSQLKGYGKLVLIRHAGGWVTAYAHNDQLLVDKGDKVLSGQVIARAGSTGSVTDPQVHFEIRRGADAVDPQRFLA